MNKTFCSVGPATLSVSQSVPTFADGANQGGGCGALPRAAPRDRSLAPMGLAAAALYLACVKNGEDKTQRDIAEAANVTEVTIRNRYKGLKDSFTI